MPGISETLEHCLRLEGAVAAALVDSKSGMCLGAAGSEEIDAEVAAAGAADVVRGMQRAMKTMGSQDAVEDILISTGQQYQLMRVTAQDPNLFLYMILRRDVANLAIARRKLAEAEKELTV